MVLGIFIGGMFVGFSLGFATMALFAVRGRGYQNEEAEALEDYAACAYSPSSKFSPSPEAAPQSSGLWLVPGP